MLALHEREGLQVKNVRESSFKAPTVVNSPLSYLIIMFKRKQSFCWSVIKNEIKSKSEKKILAKKQKQSGFDSQRSQL